MNYSDPKALKLARTSAGISQAVLAEYSGRSRSLVRDAEIGRVKLKGELALALWSAINYATEKARVQESILNGLVNKLVLPERLSELFQ